MAVLIKIFRPFGWSATSSTDISNGTGWRGVLFPWIGTMIKPPNGQVIWISGADNVNASTTISALVMGNSYTLNSYFTEILSEAAAGVDVSLNVNYDGVLGISDFFKGTILSKYNFTGWIQIHRMPLLPLRQHCQLLLAFLQEVGTNVAITGTSTDYDFDDKLAINDNGLPTGANGVLDLMLVNTGGTDGTDPNDTG